RRRRARRAEHLRVITAEAVEEVEGGALHAQPRVAARRHVVLERRGDPVPEEVGRQVLAGDGPDPHRHRRGWGGGGGAAVKDRWRAGCDGWRDGEKPEEEGHHNYGRRPAHDPDGF